MSITHGNIEALQEVDIILWHIPDYFSRQKAGFYYESPDFQFLGTTWSIIMYPNGDRESGTVGFVGLYILSQELKDFYVSFWVSIVAGERKLVEQKCYVSKNFHHTTFDKFIERSVLISYRSLFTPKGSLTIKLIGKPFCDGMDALTRNFETMLSTEEGADVTIRVKSEVFHAHSLILVARSTVFAAMFRHDMKEKITGSIDIEDCEPSAFDDFLTFIYTGKIDNLAWENVFDILFLANKYDLSDLKQICIIFMEKNLCLDFVCNVLSAADTLNLIGLKKSAKEFFLKNKKSVLKTKNWISFIREHPELLTEILMDAFSEVKYPT